MTRRILLLTCVSFLPLFLAGCYTLQPTGETAPKPGTRMAFNITDAGRVALGGSMGPEILQVEGRLAGRRGTDYVVSVTDVHLLGGGDQVWHGETVNLKSEYVSSTFERRLPLASALGAQAVPRQVRFLIATDGEDRQWEGYLARLTPDSLYVATRGPDTIAVFPRNVVRSVEHERRVSPGRAASIGCGAVGAGLGALGYFGTHDPDLPGIEKPVGVLSAIVGCAFGAVGGLVVSVRSHGWEPWIFPDSLGAPMPPNDR